MINIASRLRDVIKAAGVAISDVSIGETQDRSTWMVRPPELQAAAQPTIDAFNPTDPTQIAAERTAIFTATSRQKDELARCAQIVRSRGIAAWTAMTPQQKVAATLAEADVWATIRQFIEDNL